MFKHNENEIVKDSGSETNKTVVNLFKNNKFRNLMYISNIRAIKKPHFLIFNAKKTFNYLKQAFIKYSILQYFDLKSYI